VSRTSRTPLLGTTGSDRGGVEGIDAARLPAVPERHLCGSISPFGLRGHNIFTARGDLLG
jgi:hypothetical protein